MGFADLTPDQVDLVLEKERIVRIAFHAGDEHFLVPVFYTWFEGALCGLTTPGRKTRLGEANPAVAFQVDSLVVTGPWEWASVSGQGRWEHVADPLEFGPLKHGWDRLSREEAKERVAVVFTRWLTLIRGLVGSQKIGQSPVPFGPTEEVVVEAALRRLTG